MRTISLSLFLLCLLVGCGEGDATDDGSSEPAVTPDARSGEPAQEPDRITVDHILIPVKNPDLPPQRAIPTAMEEEEARRIAYELVDLLKGGADWATLKKRHSADPPPGGPYRLANHGVTPADRKEFPRKGMVSAFGDVGFKLQVGEIGVADFDRKTSIFGFHVIKRVR